MTAFIGKWTSDSDPSEVITVSGGSNFTSVKYANGRGPFNGFVLDLTSPTIDVDFTDDAPFVGALSGSNGKIYWNNGTVWSPQA